MLHDSNGLTHLGGHDDISHGLYGHVAGILTNMLTWFSISRREVSL